MAKQTKQKKIFHHITTLFILAVFLFSAVKVMTILKEYKDNRQVLAEVQEIYVQSDREEANDGEIRSQFYHLQDINQDIIGWIEIEGTAINYPILQTADNDFYLNQNYLKEEARAGSIFLDYRNSIESFGKNTIIYGHRMKDGSMFAGLKKYLDRDFAREHSIILLDTLYESIELEVFAAYRTTTDFYYIDTDFSDDEEYSDFIDAIQEKNSIQTDVVINSDDSIVTLSTCDYGLDSEDGRLVVHAKVIKNI